MELHDLRSRIDEIDDELVSLFQKRMDISAEVARYKLEHDMPVYDPVREREILDKLSCRVGEERKSSITALYSLLFELSRAEQDRILDAEVV